MGEELFKLEFTFTELNIILKACKKLPYEESVGIIQSAIKQYEDIQKLKEKKAKAEKLKAEKAKTKVEANKEA